jgi:outer membrane lipoprotein-sorting protein
MKAQLLAGFAGAIFVAVPAFSIDFPIDDPEVKACLERALPERAMTQELAVRVSDGDGTVSESGADLYWKRFDEAGSRALVRFTDPPRRAGVGVLLIETEDPEPEMYLYLPELRQTRRVTGKTLAGSMLGTDFSYEDFAHFQGIASASEVKRLDDAEIDGRPVYVLETTPLDETSAYQRILTSIDREQCLPLRTEFIGRNGTLRKELVAVREEIREVGNRFIPHRVIMRDLKLGSETELSVRKVKVDPKLRDRFFEPAELEVGR